MSEEKPKSIDEYKKWTREQLGVSISDQDEAHYNAASTAIKEDLEASEFWNELLSNLRDFHDEYSIETGYPLLREFQPRILTKPYKSFLLKTYRKNVLANSDWPEKSGDGWILPENWLIRINDIVRTLIEVKYLDGVEFVIQRIQNLCEDMEIPMKSFLEAREEGYYAAHVYAMLPFEVPRLDWDTERITVSVEIQITTQLQEVIRRLLHNYYEEARKRAIESRAADWQWDYKSDEFAANYLGHILHYVEAMILDVRSRQREREGTP